MDRWWLLSSTFYGTWLPGDERGFVGSVRDARPDDPPRPFRFEHDMPGTPYDADMRGLRNASAERMTGPPIYVTAEQAEVLLEQFLETTRIRGWELRAVAIMANHVHLVVGVPGDPDPKKILGDYKAYGSRPLTARWGKPKSETWWTYGGSKRKLPDEAALTAAIHYVLNRQTRPLLRWSPATGVIRGDRT